MGRLVYSVICSLDGYVADRDGGFGFATPSEEVVAAINEADRSTSTHLYGRRTYELMTGWELDPAAAQQSPESGEFARSWQRLDKVVYSASLAEVTTSRTRLERTFDAVQVRELVAAAAGDVHVSGPTLAAAAFAAGLVQEVQLYLVPRTVGGGLPALPVDVRLELAHVEQSTFADGTVGLAYTVSAPAVVSGRGGPVARRP